MAFSTFADNTPTPSVPADVGFKLSKPTYDIKDASSQNQIFNSSWPSLQVAFETNSTYGASNKVAHGLGFPPFAFAFAYGTDPSGIVKAVRRYIPTVDSTYIYLDFSYVGSDGFITSSTNINIKAFNIDLSVDIDYPLLNFSNPSQTVYDNDFGIKLAKDGKSVNSTDLKDFILHSRCQTDLIMAVKTKKTYVSSDPATNSYIIQYANKLGFRSWNYGFAKLASNDKYLFAPLSAQSSPLTKTDGVTSYLQLDLTTYSDGAVICLRDPLILNNIVSATY